MRDCIEKRELGNRFSYKPSKIYDYYVDVLEIIEDMVNVYGEYVAYVHKIESLRPILIIYSRDIYEIHI